MKRHWIVLACALAMAGCAQKEAEQPRESAVGGPGAAETDSGFSANEDQPRPALATPLDEDAEPGEGKASANPSAMSATDRALMSRVRNNLVGLTDNQGGAISSETLNNLIVQAHRGIVTVRGNVRSEAEKQVITDRLQRMDGVIFVKNELVVAGAESAAVGAAAHEESGRAERDESAHGSKASAAAGVKTDAIRPVDQ